MNYVFQLLRESVHLYRSNASLLSGYLAWLLLPLSGIILVNFLPQKNISLVLGSLLLLITTVLWIWMSIFLVRLLNKIHDGKKLDENFLQRDSWKLVIPLLVVALIQLAVILGGLILFIIPGLIFFIWFTFSQLSVILDEKRGIEALTFSRSLVQGRFFEVAGLVLLGPILIFFTYTLILSLLVTFVSLSTGVSAEVILGENPPLWMVIIDTLAEVFLVVPLMLIYSLLVYKHFKRPSSTHLHARDELKKI